MLMRLENSLRNLPDRIFILLLLVIMVVRVGPHPIGEPWVNFIYEASEAFPKATTYHSYSPLPVLLAKLLGQPHVLIWWSLFAVILLIWFVAVMLRLRSLFPNHYRIAQLIFASSQVVMLQTTFIGHYDNILVIAASLVFLWNSPWLIYLAALAAAGANPYMSFATGICVLALYFGTRDRRHRLIALIYLGISSAMLIGLHFWFNSPADATREGIVLEELGTVINASLGIWSFIFLSVLGPTWIVFGYLFLKKTWAIGERSTFKKFWVLLGVVGIPMAMSFFILDRTRLGVVVGTLPLFLFLIPELKKSFTSIPDTKNIEYPVLSAGILFWIMYPALIVDSGGLFRLPYAEFINLISGG
jgi:hypothetical protein